MGATECAIFSPGSLGKHYARNHSKIKISTCAWKLKVNPFTFTLIAAGDLSTTHNPFTLYHHASKKTTLHVRNMTLKGKH